jgi:hypothetical protein
MSELLKDINWKEILFPMFSRLRSIYYDSATTVIAANNFELANDEEAYSKVIDEINKNKDNPRPTVRIVLPEE